MAAIMRWFGRLASSLNCCKKDPDTVSEISEDVELDGIYFWEDIVYNPSFQFKVKPVEKDIDCKIKNEERLTADIQQTTAEPKVDDSNLVSNEMPTENDVVNPQTVTDIPEEMMVPEHKADGEGMFSPTQTVTMELEKEPPYQMSAQIVDDHSQIDKALKLETLCPLVNREPIVEHDIEPLVPQSLVQGITEQVEIPSQDDSEEMIIPEDSSDDDNMFSPTQTVIKETDIVTESCQMFAQIVEDLYQIDTAVIEPFVPLVQVKEIIEQIEIPSHNDIKMYKNTEQEAQSDEAFNALDIWLEADMVELSNGPFNLTRTYEGKKDLLITNPDILVIVQEQQFHVHQEVLRAHSVYFQQRLSGKSKTQYVLKIDSEYIDAQAFKILLHLLYNNDISTSCQVIPKVLRAAIYLGIASGVNACQKILDISNIANAPKLYTTVWEWDIQMEKAQSSEYFGTHFEKVFIKNDSLDLTEDQLKQLCDLDFIQSKRYDSSRYSDKKKNFFDDVALKPKMVLLNDDPLTIWNIDVSSYNFENAIFLDATQWKMNIQKKITQTLEVLAMNFEKVVMKNDYIHFDKDQVQKFFNTDIIQARSEAIVFLAALKWIEHDYKERVKCAVDILNCVRFSQMTAEELKACHHPPVLMGIMRLAEVQDILHKSLQYINANADHEEIQKASSKPRSLLLKKKPLILWEMSTYDPGFFFESETESETESSECENRSQLRNGYVSVRTQLPNMAAIMNRKKKTHVSRFIDLFKEDL